MQITRKQTGKERKRSFLPSEFLGWAEAMPTLLGKNNKAKARKPVNVGIAVADKRKIHFRQPVGKNGQKNGGDLQNIGAHPQIISQVKDKLKGANSFEKQINESGLRSYDDDKYITGPDNRKQKPS